MNKTVVIICITAITIAVIGTIGWITIVDRNPNQFLVVIGSTIGPLLLALMAFVRADQTKDAVQDVMVKADQTKNAVNTMGVNVKDVMEKTNGTFTELLQEVQALRAREGIRPPNAN